MAEMSVTADTLKNRLLLKLSGKMTTGEFQDFVLRMSRELKRLKPHFTLLNDARGLDGGGEEMERLAASVMREIVLAKPRRVARLVDSAAGVRLGEISVETGYLAATFDSLEAAEKFLDG